VEAEGEAGRTVGEGSGMVQSRMRWPDFPQPRQQTGSRQPSTLWWRRLARQRKHLPCTERGERVLEGGVRGVAAGEFRASKYDWWVGAGAAVNGDGEAGVSRPAPDSPVSPCVRHNGVALSSTMP
jgi:hypothetical protein